MRYEKEVGVRLVAAARGLGVSDARIEITSNCHRRLVGSLLGHRIIVIFAGTTKDTNAFHIACQHLRRQVRKASSSPSLSAENRCHPMSRGM